MATKLYVFPGSHPCECAEAGMRLKRVDYTRVNLIPAFHKLVIRAHFDGTTVPALAIDGEGILGSRAILRRLDELRPGEPRLLPEDPGPRARVEEAETWGHDVLQPLARQVAWGFFQRRPGAMLSYSAGAKMPLPGPLLKLGTRPVAAFASRFNNASDEIVRAHLAALPGHFDRIDGWVADGVLGGASPNVADLQIGAAIRLFGTFDDVRPLLAGRPCERLGTNGFAPPIGRVPAGVLPADWLPQA